MSSCSNRLKSFVNEFGNDVFSTSDLLLYCNLYETKVGFKRCFTVEQHLKTVKHIRTPYIIDPNKLGHNN